MTSQGNVAGKDSNPGLSDFKIQLLTNHWIIVFRQVQGKDGWEGVLLIGAQEW